MADPFGIIGVIGVATQLIQMTVQFGLDLKDAPSDAKSFILELETLRGILQDTDKHITQNPDFVDAFEGRHSTILSQLGSQSSQTPAKLMLSAFEIELRKMVEDLNKRAQSSRKSWEALKGAFTAKKTQEAMQTLNRQCQALNSLAAIDAISLSASTHAKVVEIHKTMEGVQKHQLSQEQKEKRELILKWLTPINQTPLQHIDFINRRQPGTGQWLLDHSQFKKWLETGSNTLFCPGIPGAGKTILTATVVEHLISQYRCDPAVGIAYIYCNFQRHNEQKLEDLLSSLLKQLLEPLLSLSKEITELYDRYKAKQSQASTEDLLETLRLVTTSFARVFLVVDALDECQTANGCRSRFIEGMLDLQVHSGVNLFMTSRFIPDITDKFDKSSWLEIRASREDVERYLDGQIKRSQSSIIQKMKVEIKKTISDAVDGMFLLAQIYFESLQREIKPKRVKAALNGFRQQIAGLEESERLQVLGRAYDHAMERINTQEPGRRGLANQVLSWITHARRPFTTTELQHAVTVDVGDSELDQEDLVQIDDMVAVCAGLVTIDEESSIIRLVHFTTQEYFQRAREKLFPAAEQEIATICITYLSFEEFEKGACDTNHKFERRLEDKPLYNYAARRWGDHVRRASISGLSEEIVRFLNSPALIEAATQALYVHPEKWSESGEWSQEFPKHRTAFHVVAHFGMVGAITELRKTGADPHAKDGDGVTPLHLASMNGHDSIVQELVEDGADVNIWTHTKWTPLHKASEHGHDVIVRQLLAAGADINAKDRHAMTPLHIASEHGHDLIVQQLLAAGAVTNAKDWAGMTPLHTASEHGHDVIVQQLLAAGAGTNAKDWAGMTPLHTASEYGHDAVVQQLLAAGADVNAKDRKAITPLHTASEHNYDVIVQQLLAAGADTNAKDRNMMTTLHSASRCGCDAVVQQLLEAGADVNAKDCHGMTPLYTASEDGHNVIVQHLLAAGADVNTKARWEGTPLHEASKLGHYMIVQQLLAAGADTNAKGEYAMTPLHEASKHGHDVIVQQLLAAGADINAKDSTRVTPLHIASRRGRDVIVQQLLTAGADVNDKDSAGMTPLYIASEDGHDMTIQQQLTAGADVNAKDSAGMTPFYIASEDGHDVVIQKLLMVGADFNTKRWKGTPLHEASKHGHDVIVQQLLAAGADINAKDGNAMTTLHIASEHGHDAIVQQLLAAGADTNAKHWARITPLHIASRRGRGVIAQHLLAAGADVNAKDWAGMTPLHTASEHGHDVIVQQLLAAGADINTKDEKAMTPLDWASHTRLEQRRCETAFLASWSNANT